MTVIPTIFKKLTLVRRLTYGFSWNSGTEFHENPANPLVADKNHTRPYRLTQKTLVANRDPEVRSSGTMPNGATVLFRYTLSW